MTYARHPAVSFLVIVAALAALLVPRTGQLRRLAEDPGTSAQARQELKQALGEPPVPGAVAPPPAPRPPLPDFSAGRLEELVADPQAGPREVFRCIQLALWSDRLAEAARFSDVYRSRFGLPEDVEELRTLAQIHADNRENGKAAELWTAIYRASPDHETRRRALRAVAALEPSAAAIKLHVDYLASYDADLEARERLARLHQAAGDGPAYAEQIEEILRRDPERDHLRIELAWACRGMRDWKRLIPHLEALRERGKDDPSLQELYLLALEEAGATERHAGALLRSAQRHFNRRDADACIERLEKLAGHADARPDQLLRGVQLALWLGRVADAARLCDALIGRFGVPGETEQVALLAQIFADNGEPGKAADLWTALYRVSPDREGRRKAAAAVAALDPSPRAIEVHLDYLSRHEDDLEARERLARLHRANADVVRYMDQLQEILRRDPARDALRLELVQACVQTGDPARLIPHVEELRRRGRDDPAFTEPYLLALDETGQSDKLVAELDRLGRWRALADLHEARQELERAAAAWEGIFGRSSQPEAGEKAAASHEHAGRWDDARRLYRELHRRFPGEKAWTDKLVELHDVEHERSLVLAHEIRGERDEALQAGLDLLTHAPSDPVALRVVAEAFYAEGDRASALAHYRRLERLAPEDVECAYRILECSAREGDPAGARGAAGRVLGLLARKPTSPRARFMQAIALIHTGRPAEARPMLLELLKAPVDPESLPETASALLAVGEHAGLDALLEKWRRVDPGSEELRQIHARSLLKQGRLEEALRAMRGNPAFMTEYVDALLALGRWKEARRTLQEQPSDPSAREQLERIDATFGPEASVSASVLRAEREDHARVQEAYRAFVTERIWLAEAFELRTLSGRVSALNRDADVKIAHGRLEGGWHDGVGFQSFVRLGAWEGDSRSHVWAGVGADLMRDLWTLSADIEFNRPWDIIVEAAAFDGLERRLLLQASRTFDPVLVHAAVRYSHYTVGDGLGVLDGGESAREAAWSFQVETRLASGEEGSSLRAGFLDGALRTEQAPETGLWAVAQLAIANLDAGDALLEAIPLAERSRALKVGMLGQWAVAPSTLLGGEAFIGQDRARGLDLGDLHEVTARGIRDFGRRARLQADLTWSNERPVAGGSQSWLFQIAFNANF